MVQEQTKQHDTERGKNSGKFAKLSLSFSMRTSSEKRKTESPRVLQDDHVVMEVTDDVSITTISAVLPVSRVNNSEASLTEIMKYISQRFFHLELYFS